jgi:hypothetical protein
MEGGTSDTSSTCFTVSLVRVGGENERKLSNKRKSEMIRINSVVLGGIEF